jgi:hypothetical protein
MAKKKWKYETARRQLFELVANWPPSPEDDIDEASPLYIAAREMHINIFGAALPPKKRAWYLMQFIKNLTPDDKSLKDIEARDITINVPDAKLLDI